MLFKIQMRVPNSLRLQDAVETATHCMWEPGDKEMAVWVDCALINRDAYVTPHKFIADECLRRMKTLWPLNTYQIVGFE